MNQQGIAMVGALMVMLVLALISATLLHLSGHESLSATAGRDAAVLQHLAEGAGDLIVGWFHGHHPASPEAASILAKRHRNAAGASSFFDAANRSQFVGTAERPDLTLPGLDGELFNGIVPAQSVEGRVDSVKVYAPSRPGLLCTVDTTVSLRGTPGLRHSIVMQLAALEVPPIRAAVQAGGDLGVPATRQESPVLVHWGDLKVQHDLVLRKLEAFPAKTASAPITGRSYEEAAQREDRWTEAWIGGQVHALEASDAGLPANLHVQQQPVPGVHMDSWPYEELKRIAKQHGRYVAIDRDGLLYPQGIVTPGQGVSADELLRSAAVGDQLGYLFIDTLDQTPPRADNLGTVVLRAPYLEGILVVQGHVVLSPQGGGQAVPAITPPLAAPDGTSGQVPVQLTGVRLNGVLYVTGNITVHGHVRVFGSVTAEGMIGIGETGATLEVWYNAEHAQGLYRGLPVVYRAPGTWRAKS
jgi:hypothetical protein